MGEVIPFPVRKKAEEEGGKGDSRDSVTLWVEFMAGYAHMAKLQNGEEKPSRYTKEDIEKIPTDKEGLKKIIEGSGVEDWQKEPDYYTAVADAWSKVAEGEKGGELEDTAEMQERAAVGERISTMRAHLIETQAEPNLTDVENFEKKEGRSMPLSELATTLLSGTPEMWERYPDYYLGLASAWNKRQEERNA